MNPFAVVAVIAAFMLWTVLVLVLWLRRVEEDRKIRDEIEYAALRKAIQMESLQVYNTDKMAVTKAPSPVSRAREGLKQVAQDLFGSLDYDIKIGTGSYGSTASTSSGDQHCDNPSYTLVCLSD